MSLDSEIAHRARPTVGPVLILSAEPPVFLTGIPYDDYLGVARPFAEKFGNVDAGFIVFPTWSLEQAGLAEAIRERHADHAARFPRHVFRFLCNTAREAELLQEQGLRAEFLNKNFTVSDTIFRPLPDVQVEFDAIYNARFVPEKRHELAALIPRVGYIAYVEPEANRAKEFSAIYHKTLARNPRHVLLNETREGMPVPMPHDRVNAAQARGAVGLILSAVEGSSYCSMEYMLAGLPVVSTPSLGGRDVYFDPDFCIVCPPDPAAVRDAVAELKARQIPRQVVRAATLAKITPKRARFLELVDDVLAEIGAPRRFAGRPWQHAGSGVRWGYYASHIEVLAEARRARLARKFGVDAQLLAGAQLTAEEMEPIVQALQGRPNSRMLVFGCGNESGFWEAINASGPTSFIEDDPRWLDAAQQKLRTSRVYLVDYRTRLGDWRELLDAPKKLEMAMPPDIAERSWDVILVDGPAGHEPSSPGRMKAIFAASRLVAPGGVVFVHDCEREVEAQFAAKYLGESRVITEARGRALLKGYRF